MGRPPSEASAALYARLRILAESKTPWEAYRAEARVRVTEAEAAGMTRRRALHVARRAWWEGAKRAPGGMLSKPAAPPHPRPSKLVRQSIRRLAEYRALTEDKSVLVPRWWLDRQIEHERRVLAELGGTEPEA